MPATMDMDWCLQCSKHIGTSTSTTLCPECARHETAAQYFSSRSEPSDDEFYSDDDQDDVDDDLLLHDVLDVSPKAQSIRTWAAHVSSPSPSDQRTAPPRICTTTWRHASSSSSSSSSRANTPPHTPKLLSLHQQHSLPSLCMSRPEPTTSAPLRPPSRPQQHIASALAVHSPETPRQRERRASLCTGPGLSSTSRLFAPMVGSLAAGLRAWMRPSSPSPARVHPKSSSAPPGLALSSGFTVLATAHDTRADSALSTLPRPSPSSPSSPSHPSAPSLLSSSTRSSTPTKGGLSSECMTTAGSYTSVSPAPSASASASVIPWTASSCALNIAGNGADVPFSRRPSYPHLYTADECASPAYRSRGRRASKAVA